MTNEEITTKVEKAEHDITYLKSDAQDFRYGLEAVFEALNRISDQQEKFWQTQAKIQATQDRTEEIVEKLAAKQFEYEERQARADERQARADERQARADERLDHLTQTVDRYIASRNNGSNGQP